MPKANDFIKQLATDMFYLIKCAKESLQITRGSTILA